MSGGNTWPEKAELAAAIQHMLKTAPVGMFALARDAVDEICLFDARGVRFTITPPIYGLSREYYTVIEWGEGGCRIRARRTCCRRGGDCSRGSRRRC
jgi:hypothetical protein